jgi:hypothetical protein
MDERGSGGGQKRIDEKRHRSDTWRRWRIKEAS